MKQSGCFLLAFVLACSGCVELPTHRHKQEPPPPPPPPAPVKPERPPAPVTPGQVTESNAHAKAEALDDEIARDEQAEIPAAGSDQTKPAKP
jgi:hypothetical protein